MNRLRTVLVIVVAIFVSCQSSKETQQEVSIPVEAVKVSSSQFEKSIKVSGNVTGQRTIRMGFMVAGKISTITKEEGESIAKGRLLAKLEADRYQLARNIAKAKYDEVSDEYKRLSELFEKGSISESDYVKITSGLEQAKSNYLLQERNLKDTRLYAPINGVLIKRGVEPGEIIGTGTPVFAISDIDTVEVDAAVPEGELKYLHIGDLARVQIPALDTIYEGRITQIGAAAHPSTRTFTVKIDLVNDKMKLKPGMVAEVIIGSGQQDAFLAISPKAVLQDLDRTNYVFVADAKKEKAYKRKVIVGDLKRNLIAIQSGLNAGELVIIGGQDKIQDGSAISIQK